MTPSTLPILARLRARSRRTASSQRGIALALVAQLFVLAGSTSAAAQEPHRGPAHELKLDLDLPIVLIAGGITSSYFLLPETPGVACAPGCDRAHINRFDRMAAGLYDPAWATVGDIATASTLAVPLLVVMFDEGVKNGLNDDLVVAEAALVASAMQVSLSFAVARPRPRVYGD